MIIRASISIIVPTCNRADLIGETIESVLAQTCPDWELIIVDDHSTDNTDEVIASFAQRDGRIRYFKRDSKHRGAPVCRNEGVQHSAGEYLVFIDSDDLLAAGCIRLRRELLAAHKNLDVLVCQTGVFNETPGDLNLVVNRLDHESDLDQFIACNNTWFTTGPTWKREFFEKIGGWDEDLPCWQEWELTIRALAHSPRFVKQNVIDSFFRIGDNNRKRVYSPGPKYLCGSLKAITRAYTVLQSESALDKKRTSLMRLHLSKTLITLCRYGFFKHALPWIREYRPLLTNSGLWRERDLLRESGKIFASLLAIRLASFSEKIMKFAELRLVSLPECGFRDVAECSKLGNLDKVSACGIPFASSKRNQLGPSASK